MLIRESLCQTQTVAQLLLTPTLAEIVCQLLRQLCYHLLAIFTPLPLQQFRADAPANVPVELGEFGIDRAGHPLPGGINEMAHIGKQPVIGWNGAGHVRLSIYRPLAPR